MKWAHFAKDLRVECFIMAKRVTIMVNFIVKGTIKVTFLLWIGSDKWPVLYLSYTILIALSYNVL